jgi:hypothetical protein
MIPHTRTILTSSPSHQHDAVLLDIVTLTRYVRRDHPSAGQPYTSRLPLAGVGLLRSGYADFETDTLLLRRAGLCEGGRDGVTGAFACAAFLVEDISRLYTTEVVCGS